MTGSKLTPFPNLGSWQAPEELLALNKPMHEVLADFIHGCSPDPDTRTVATTALLLSLWQLQGRALTPEVPSMLLLQAGEPTDDPIDQFIRGLVYDAAENKPRIQTKGPFMGAPIDLAPTAMKNAFLKRQELDRNLPVDGSERYYEAKNAEEKFHAARLTAFGHGSSRPYAKAWHPEYGLLTDEDNQIILRLNDDEDRAAFCNDVVNDTGKLAFAKGIGPNLFMVPKRVSLSGSLTPGNWKGETAGMSISLGWPLFALPHFADAPLTTGNKTTLQSLSMIWKNTSIPPVSASPCLPVSDWINAYQTALRRRLTMLPGGYEFTVLQAVHQLDGVCDRIVNFAADSETGLEERVALYQDLYQHALRCMVIGVAGLSWYGHGLCLGPEGDPLRVGAVKLLKYLREKSPTSKSVILQNCHLKKHQRDVLLEHLAAEDLVRVDGATVSATTFSEFVRALYKREEFPQVTNHWAKVRESRKVTKASA